MATMSERFVNNMMTILIARVSMIVTPFLLAFIWNNFDKRLLTVEETTARQSSEIQDHESRLKFSAEKAGVYADQIERRFNDLTGSLKDMNAQIITMNGSIIRLQTTIENRLPARAAKLDAPDLDPQHKVEEQPQ